MSSLHLSPETTALVIIDLQKGIVGIPTAPHPAADVVERSRRLAQHFRLKHATVVYVHVDMANTLRLSADSPMRDPNAPAPPPSASELVPEAGYEPALEDLLITKRHWGAFAGTELEKVLRHRGIETVVLTGIATNYGVESTVRQGTGLGFAFVVVEDACSSRDANDHRFAFERIFPRIARIRNTDEVIASFEWAGPQS